MVSFVSLIKCRGLSHVSFIPSHFFSFLDSFRLCTVEKFTDLTILNVSFQYKARILTFSSSQFGACPQARTNNGLTLPHLRTSIRMMMHLKVNITLRTRLVDELCRIWLLSISFFLVSFWNNFRSWSSLLTCRKTLSLGQLNHLVTYNAISQWNLHTLKNGQVSFQEKKKRNATVR